jgi:hypothetical protein
MEMIHNKEVGKTQRFAAMTTTNKGAFITIAI